MRIHHFMQYYVGGGLGNEAEIFIKPVTDAQSDRVS